MHTTSILFASLFYGAYAAPGHRIVRPRQSDEAGRAAAVRDAFQFAWNGYSQYAFPNDELRPVSNTFSNSRNGWGASAADALSTALVMDLPEIVKKIVDYIPSINFTQPETADSVSLFETTIRYLGGMLAGYDLLKGPLANVAEEGNVRNLSCIRKYR